MFPIHSMEKSDLSKKKLIHILYTDDQKIEVDGRYLFICLGCSRYLKHKPRIIKQHILAKVLLEQDEDQICKHTYYVHYQYVRPHDIALFAQGGYNACPIPFCMQLGSKNKRITLQHLVDAHTNLEKVEEHFKADEICWCPDHMHK